MAASSERKIEANRRNARRSTGPKSFEGKEKSRRNGWKHGMAAVVVVPEEETKALDLAIAAWSEQLGPEDTSEASLVHQMAAADVRMRRCMQINEAALEGDAVEAVRRWEAKRRHRVRRQAQDLKDDPVNVVADLEAIRVQLVAKEKEKEKAEAAATAEAAVPQGAATRERRTEPNPAADRAANDRRNPSVKKELGNEAAAGHGEASERTEPRFPHLTTPPKGASEGDRSASEAAKRPAGVA